MKQYFFSWNENSKKANFHHLKGQLEQNNSKWQCYLWINSHESKMC